MINEKRQDTVKTIYRQLGANSSVTATFPDNIVAFLACRRNNNFALFLGDYWSSVVTAIAGTNNDITVTKSSNSRTCTITNGSGYALVLLLFDCESVS